MPINELLSDNRFWIIAGLAVVALAVVLSIVLNRRARERRIRMKERFGPEYDRAREQYGERADRVLAARERRVQKLQIKDLTNAERTRFQSLWTAIQAEFVDDPRGAVTHANDLIKEVMHARGYSKTDGYDQRVADLSVDHPDVIQHYRAARALAQADSSALTSTEELRQAVVHFRVLFADLLAPTPVVANGVLRPSHA